MPIDRPHMCLLEALAVWGTPARVGEVAENLFEESRRRGEAAEFLASEVLLCYRTIQLLSEMLPEFSAGTVRQDLVWSEQTVAACIQRANEPLRTELHTMPIDPQRLRDLADTLEGDDWQHPLGSAQLCRDAADEIERLRAALRPFAELFRLVPPASMDDRPFRVRCDELRAAAAAMKGGE